MTGPHDANLVIPVKRLRPDAILPTKAHRDDAGWDLRTVEPFFLRTGQARAVATGIALAIPTGWYGQILGRSSLARDGIAVLGGVIDAGYRGEVVVMLLSHGGSHRFSPGDKIAQLVFLPVPAVVMSEVEDLGASERGEGGFGSSGA